MSQTAAAPRHHLFVSGTGRAGTSFLVRFLGGMGLQTHLQQHGLPRWHEVANAGLEDIPLGQRVDGLPYVVKTPWLSEFADDVLGNPAIVIDAVILPVRDLVEAATSRVVVERGATHRVVDWMAEAETATETWGGAPGGVVYSLNPLDQGRLLAVWFHQLVRKLVQAGVPLVLLDFPRLAQDADYLFEQLRPYLPPTATLAQARTVHAGLADPAKIRIGEEREFDAGLVRPGVAYDSAEATDRMALRREVLRLRSALAAAEARAAEAAALAVTSAPAPEPPPAPAPVVVQVATPGAALEAEAVALRVEAATLRDTVAALRDEAAGLKAELGAAQARMATLDIQRDAALAEAARALQAVEEMRDSTSWKLTGWMRAIARVSRWP